MVGTKRGVRTRMGTMKRMMRRRRRSEEGETE